MRISPTDVLGSLLRKPAPPSKRLHPIEHAAVNQLRVLQAVAAYGHLRSADIAAACWPAIKSAMPMAQRTVRTLVALGQLMGRSNALGGTSYVLTRRGASRLELHGTSARHGLDLAVSGATYRHATLTSRWCIHKRCECYQAFNEYALVNGYAPVSRAQLLQRFKKMPDAILVRGDKLWLCETESAVKALPELLRIVALAEHVGRKVHPELPYILAGVVIVFDAQQNHARRIAKAAHERWWRYSATEQATLYARITLSRVSLSLPLVWRGCEDTPLTLTACV